MKQVGKEVEAERVTKATRREVSQEDFFDQKIENAIHEGDAAEVLKIVPDGVASLVTFSPPYFGASVTYEPPLPIQSYDEYLSQLSAVLVESYRVSRIGGRLAVIVDTTHCPEAGEGGDDMLPLAADITAIARRVGWKYWTDLCWVKRHASGNGPTFGSLGRCSAPGWGRDHEWILLFFRENKKLDGDLANCDLSREEHLSWFRTAWQLAAETRRDILAAHPAPCPEPLIERLVKLLTFRGNLVIDPMVGSGTATAVAARLGRRFIGIDRSPNYCEFARQRTARGQNAFAKSIIADDKRAELKELSQYHSSIDSILAISSNSMVGTASPLPLYDADEAYSSRTSSSEQLVKLSPSSSI